MKLTEQLLGSQLLPDLLPETQAALWDWATGQVRRQAAGQPVEALAPSFPYQSLPASARLRYQLVSWNSLPSYLHLFAGDPSPFVDARFRQRALLESYAVELLTERLYSWKRSGCDWLLYHRADDTPAGVLHLYDLSHEQIGRWVPPCTVGYAVAAPFRRQGFGREALLHLLPYTAALFGRTEMRAVVAADNTASMGLLRACGFSLLEERPVRPHRNAEQLWQRFVG